jgi:cell division protein FtsI/penicillin-binding protein 2
MTARGFASNKRFGLVAALVVICFGVLAARLVQLHVLDRDRYLAQIQNTRHDIVPVLARRGDIYDTRRDLLATSKTEITLAIDPWALVKKLDFQRSQARRDRIAAAEREKRSKLAVELGVSADEIEAFFTPSWRDVSVAQDTRDDAADGRIRVEWKKLREGVSEESYARIEALRITGLTAERSYKRIYPHNDLAAHLIGFLNKEGAASGGIESFADVYLSGHSGWREVERDARRTELAQFRSREVSPSDGWGVVLSIDTAIQHIAEQEMAAIVSNFNPAKATIIVSDARTGFLLALANYPTFNLNDYGNTPLDVQRNIAATDLIEPGSTFKIVAAAGALNEGLVTSATKFDCTLASILYQGRERRFMRDDHRYDHPLAVSEIISHSSNVGAAQLAMRLGDRRFYDYARAFGFGERTGFPLGREEPGILADPAKWSTPDITRIPAGYSVAATPLQVHYAMATIASGGSLLRPQIIRQILDSQGEVVYSFKPATRRTVIAPATAESMAAMLQKVASEEGTAKVAAIPGFEVAGKTGTAQKLIGGRYSDRDHIGSFVGFFPASRPRVVITVVVDDGHPQNGRIGYGATVAAPSFRKIAEQLIQYLDIKPVTDPAPGRLLARNEGGRP